jgi:hypothetical protein
MPRTKAKPSKKKAKPAVAAGSSSKRELIPPVIVGAGYVAGDIITHPMFGEGTVTAVDADKLTIKFKDGRVKQIVEYYVKRRR